MKSTPEQVASYLADQLGYPYEEILYLLKELEKYSTNETTYH